MKRMAVESTVCALCVNINESDKEWEEGKGIYKQKSFYVGRVIVPGPEPNTFYMDDKIQCLQKPFRGCDSSPLCM